MPSWVPSKYFEDKLQSVCFFIAYLAVLKNKRGLDLVSLPHFLHNFPHIFYHFYRAFNKGNDKIFWDNGCPTLILFGSKFSISKISLKKTICFIVYVYIFNFITHFQFILLIWTSFNFAPWNGHKWFCFAWYFIRKQ